MFRYLPLPSLCFTQTLSKSGSALPAKRTLSPNSWQHDGYVNVRHHSASEETQVNILKANADLTALKALPQLTPIPGLDIQRQWYVYENIRQHCKSTLAADKTCPKPKLPKPSTRVANCATSSISTGTSADEPPAKRKKVVTCSICKQPGHTKRSCSNNRWSCTPLYVNDTTLSLSVL